MKHARKVVIAIAMAAASGCGGPETIEPPPPPQSVNAYWVGIEDLGNVHLHITLAQAGTALTLLPGCFVDRCSFYPFSPAGATAIGSNFPVAVMSVSGSFNNPNISFTFTLVNNRTFTFTGRVTEDRLMRGAISGATLTSGMITFEKRE